MIADRYRLERKVGGGRVSAVWRVCDEINARPCAIKILHRSMHKHPEALTRFSLEDRLARELSGPHFPERIGSGVWDGMRYIAWRWHDGESLRALFERNPKQDAPTVYSIVQETCQALTLVHAAGYTHGDLKPENVLFADHRDGERSRQVKLLGFGVASRLSRPSAAGFGIGRRRPGEIVGTPLYSSPDLILGRVPNGGQADLWALAVMVYEALTGRPPFLGFDIGAVLHAILEKRAPRPTSIADNLPGSFDTWWAQALAQEFDTPSEFASALARALAPALRTSHTQRSASLPERLPPTLEALTPMPTPPPAAPAPAPPPTPPARVNTSTTVTGIGPADIGLLSRLGATSEPAAAWSQVAEHVVEPPRNAVEAGTATDAPHPSAEPPRPVADAARAAVAARAPEPPRPVAHAARPSDAARAAEPPRPAVADAGTAEAPRVADPSGPAAEAPQPVGDALRPAAQSLRPAVDTLRPTADAQRLVEALRPAAEAARPAAEPPRPGAEVPRAADATRPEPAPGTTTETFAPLPSPLRDLGADGARKTLVGITPPLGVKPPQPVASAAAPAAAAPAARAPVANTIEGAPCRPIETSQRSLFDTDLLGDALRRPANPTVPFPRPRVLPRHPGSGATATGGDETPDIGGRNSWHGTTTRTLRVVLTSPDHKPQRVAAALVCAAAALVIFAIGRSPIAGTAGIGQATESLSAEPGPKPAPPPVLADPAPRSELAAASGSDSMSELPPPAASGGTRDPAPLEADELAPGLVPPPREGNGPTRQVSDTSAPDAAVPGSSARKSTRAAVPPPSKSSVKKPTPPASSASSSSASPASPASLPTPPRKNSTELDFGI
jgi:serine/threonine protein kinase